MSHRQNKVYHHPPYGLIQNLGHHNKIQKWHKHFPTGLIGFGKYFPPTEKYYYKISENKKNENFIPFSFEEYVIPEGIILPLDKNGNLIKGSINLDIKEKIWIKRFTYFVGLDQIL